MRRALDIAIDRSQIAGQTWGGFAKPDVLALPAAYGQAQPGVDDLATARRLLAAAGYAHGLTLPVYVPYDLGVGNQGSELYLLGQQLAQIGITLAPTVVYDDDQLYALAGADQVPSAIEDLVPLLGGAAFTLITSYGGLALDPASPASHFGYADPALAKLLAQLARTPVSAPSAR